MNPVVAEMRRQRRELLIKNYRPAVVYLGPDEYRSFKVDRGAHEIFVVIASVDLDGRTKEMWEGLELFERYKPGVHVCEAAR